MQDMSHSRGRDEARSGDGGRCQESGGEGLRAQHHIKINNKPNEGAVSIYSLNEICDAFKTRKKESGGEAAPGPSPCTAASTPATDQLRGFGKLAWPLWPSVG